MPGKNDPISQTHLATGRAVDQLRRQLGIGFQEDSGIVTGVCPVEGLTPGIMARLQGLPGAHLYLLLTGARARSLGLSAKDVKSVRIDAQDLSLPEILALADPLAEAKLPKITLLPIPASQDLLLTLAKYASLLPALLTVESDMLPPDWLRVRASDVREYWADPPLEVVPLAHAKLPIHEAENVTLTCFRTRWGTSTHLALIAGNPEKDDAPLVRVHSSCITGDILGSLRCDCGDQLHMALAQITQAGSGVLIYLHQEGRGIGIANKLRAYTLQERGVDTYEANLMLGFDEDERDFSIAGAILKKLGITKIRLLTNNPHKLEALEKTGINIAARVPLVAPSGRHNHLYLEAKEKKAGHVF